MLTVSGLTTKYGKTIANDDLSFEAPTGRISILVGPNGAGKSTAIKAIAGLLRFQGKITISGHDNKTLEAKRELGYIPEAPSVYDLLTVEEHMQFIAKAYSLDSGWKERSEYLLDRFELDEHRKKFGRELSKGMHQKVSICCALLPQPKLLLVDEPMVGLDPHAIKELKQLFLEERGRGTAILISTHLLSSVEDMWDQALVLMRGRFAARRLREEEASSGESLETMFFRITEGEGA